MSDLTACGTCVHCLETDMRGHWVNAKCEASPQFNFYTGRRREYGYKYCRDVNTDGHCELYIYGGSDVRSGERGEEL